MIGWGRGSAQNASRFSAMARDGDGRGREGKIRLEREFGIKY